MNDKIASFVNEFPLADLDAEQPPELDLTPDLIRLLHLAGYDDSVIHKDVEMEIDEGGYEPTDIEFGDTITLPIYVAKDMDSSPHLVGWGDDGILPLDEGRGGHAIYESIRLAHETAEANFTIVLTPYDLLIYDGTGSIFHGKGPIEYYSLYDLDQQPVQHMIQEIEPPSSNF